MEATKQITGYKWANSPAATGAKNAARTHFGLPVSPQSDTTEAIEPLQNKGALGSFWYWQGNLSPLFGDPQVFMINYSDPLIESVL